MHIISIVMDSKHNVDNFQSVLVAKTAKFPMKKDAGKFSVFWKTCLHGIISISACSSLLDESKNVYFILVSWADKTQESKMCRWLTRFLSVWKTTNFCVTSRSFFSLFFIVWTSIWLSLFIYTSCHDYHSLITPFLHRGDLLQCCHNRVLYLPIKEYYTSP